MKILVFGNLMVEEDNLALKLIPKLKQKFLDIEFKEFDPTESLENEIEDKKLIILDMAVGIDEIKVLNFSDIDKLEVSGTGMHDFDLNYNLKLLKKMDLIDDVKIIALPIGIGEGKGFNQIQLILRKWVAQDIQGS